MLKEYIKPELIEDSRVKLILQQHKDEILSIISQEEICYEDFRWFVKWIVGKDTEIDFEKGIENGSYLFERELKQLYDDELFRNFSNKDERLRVLIKILWKLMENGQ